MSGTSALRALLRERYAPGDVIDGAALAGLAQAAGLQSLEYAGHVARGERLLVRMGSAPSREHWAAVPPGHFTALMERLQQSGGTLHVDEQEFAGAVQRLLAAECITMADARVILAAGAVSFDGYGVLRRYEVVA